MIAARLDETQLGSIHAFIEAFPAKRLKSLKLRDWREALQIAWMQDWPEQRGELRRLRNAIQFNGTAAIIAAYDKQAQS